MTLNDNELQIHQMHEIYGLKGDSAERLRKTSEWEGNAVYGTFKD